MKEIAIFALLASPLLSAQTYTEGTYFTADKPTGWEKRETPFGLSAEEKKVFGVEVFGPDSADGLAARISIHYYAPGNLVHKTFERFIKLHSGPALGASLDGERYGPVKDGLLAGRKAKLFERVVFEYIPPRSIKPKKVAIYERFAVVPAKAGFYVLRYHAPEDIAKANLKAFENMLKLFKPLMR